MKIGQDVVDEVSDWDSEYGAALESGLRSSEGGGVSAPALDGTPVSESGSPATAVGMPKTREWNQLLDMILTSYLRGEENWDSDQIKDLASRLKSTPEELLAIVSMVDEKVWGEQRLRKLVEFESISYIGYNWDRLEAAALHKMSELVATGRVSDIDKLLSIAKAANAASRKGNKPPNPLQDSPGVGIGININNFNGGEVNPMLPGAGNLGHVTLTLTNRTVEQLARGREIDGESQRLLDNAEMLGEDDIKELGKIIDGRPTSE